MEINTWGNTIIGGVATENIVEGRMVTLTKHSYDHDFGSQTDLPGFGLPDNTQEAAMAHYVVTFQSDDRPLPIVRDMPHFDDALRYGFEHAANAPFQPTLMYLTHPAQQECLTIYAGDQCIAFGEGIYTVPSGCYVYSAEIEIPGMPLGVCDKTTDGPAAAGKLHYQTTVGYVVAEVYRFHSDDSRLTFKILH